MIIAPQSDWRAAARSAQQMATVAVTDADAAKALAMSVDSTVKAAQIVFESYVSITRSSFLSVSLAPQEAPFNIAAAKVGDIIFIHRAGKVTNGSGANPAVVVGGVSLESTGFVAADGTVTVYYSIPTLTVAVGATLTIPLRIRGFRAS